MQRSKKKFHSKIQKQFGGCFLILPSTIVLPGNVARKRKEIDSNVVFIL